VCLTSGQQLGRERLVQTGKDAARLIFRELEPHAAQTVDYAARDHDRNRAAAKSEKDGM
jgi:hypothetical protein